MKNIRQLIRSLNAKCGLLRRRCCIAFAIMMCPYAANSNNAALIVITDIAPVHSLASMVMGTTGSPHLLVPPAQSPHHFSLKPSQASLLSTGDLVIFIDNDFAPPLTRQINATNNGITRLELNSTLINKSHGPNDEHSNQGSHQNNEEPAEHIEENKHSDHGEHDDLHTWLNPKNAVIWLQHIAQALSDLDPANANVYNLNAQDSIAQLNLLNENLTNLLQDVRNEPYLVYHDAYQHFATAFKLAPAESIAISDARKPGARRLSAMRKKARRVTCVFSENQHSDALVNTVTVGLNVKRGILDPVGSSLEQGPDLYTGLLTQLAESFKLCLSKN